jgi:tRNA(Arg) A34 adenosine deaminase TadA
MTDEQLMLLAIEEAKASSEPVRCGVVIAKDGKVVAKGYNTQRKTHDVSAHAEINTLRLAGSVLGAKNLSDCVIYCTCEPCTMCISAIIFAKIPKIYFGSTLQEASPNNMPITVTTDYMLSHSTRTIQVTSGLLADECRTINNE